MEINPFTNLVAGGEAVDDNADLSLGPLPDRLHLLVEQLRHGRRVQQSGVRAHQHPHTGRFNPE